MKKKPLLVVYSDIHYHVYNQYNEGDRRVKDAMKAQKLIKLESEKLKVPTLFVGDLFQNEKVLTNKLLSYTLPHFKKIWGAKGQPTYAISGNHDQSEQNTLDHKSPSYVDTLSKIFPGLICMDHNSVKLTDSLHLHGIPYLTHDMGLLDSIKAIKKGKGLNVLMLHTTLPDSQDTDGRRMETDTIGNKVMKALKTFDLVVVGHIHKPMEIGNNILQVGATNHQRKTDKNCDLGFWIIYNDLSRKFIPLDLPKFKELEKGEDIPDNKHFYYYKESKVEITKTDISPKKFSDLSDRTKLAKNYIKTKGEKVSKEKQEALVNALKNAE